MISSRHKHEAESLRLALFCGCESVKSVVGWADSILVELDDPDYLFVEISTLKPASKKNLISLLNEIGQGSDQLAALRCLLGRASWLARNGKLEFRKFTRWLYYSRQNWWDLPDEFNFVPMLEDEYSFAERKIFRRIKNVDRELAALLRKYETENSGSSHWYSI